MSIIDGTFDLSLPTGSSGLAGSFDTFGAYVAPQPTSSSDWQSSLLGVGTSFLSGLTQIELARRSAKVSGPQITSNQAPIQTDITTRAVSGLGGLQLGNVLPFVLLGLGVWVIMGRG